jgi:hypothetical protein
MAPCIATGDQELAILGMSDVNIGYNFLILAAMLVFYRLFAYLCLVYVIAQLLLPQRVAVKHDANQPMIAWW